MGGKPHLEEFNVEAPKQVTEVRVFSTVAEVASLLRNHA
jgi:hypothetical protein